MYATIEFYKNVYHGNSVPDSSIQEVLERASFDVDVLTRRKIHTYGGFEKLSDFEKQQVQLAVCSQAEFLYTKSSIDGISSYSIGDVSVNLGDVADMDKRYDRGCIQYLNLTRLMYRGL